LEIAGSWARNQRRADSALIDRLLLAAAQLRYFDRIEGKEIKSDSELSNYGLRNPKRSLEFDGAEKVTLFLGGRGERRPPLRAHQQLPRRLPSLVTNC
jgi:hypothetical protein